VVDKADLFVAFTEPANNNFYDVAGGNILYDPLLLKTTRDDAPERHVAVPATMLSKQHFNNPLFANMIMLGALTRIAEMDIEAMRKAMLEVIPRFHEQNLKALDLGYNLECAMNAVTGSSGSPIHGAARGM
jgi:2-oxoglutarate ferredoxin oxidoreductase subunit gamma